MNYPYALGNGKIPILFQTIGEKGIPPKVNNKWLEQYGMGSSNDRRLIPVLKFIDFVDSSGSPTERWRQYRGADSRKVMAAAIREGYSQLYNDHPNAHEVPEESLITYFKSKTENDSSTVGRVVATFRALIGLADMHSVDSLTKSEFSNTTKNSELEQPSHGKQRRVAETNLDESKQPSSGEQPITINVNVQFTLPDTDNPDVFEALFTSLRRNILDTRRPRND